MKLDNVVGHSRRKTPDLARHARKCVICNHKARPSIDADFLAWRNSDDIVHGYALPHRMYLYRHAKATGLIARRKATICSALDSIIERAESAPVTAATVIRAIRAYSCITKNGDWIEPPRSVLVRRSESRPSASPTTPRIGSRKSNRYAGIRK